MIPEPIAPYNSGLVVLFNATLFIIFLLNFSVMSSLTVPKRGPLDVSQDLAVPLAPLLLTAISSFRRDCLASLAFAPFGLSWGITHTKSVQVIPALFSPFSFRKNGS
jgi:hypothetical protein